jgi:hypothetical protein
MIAATTTRLARHLLLVVGAGDVGAGLALACVPASALGLAGLAAPNAEATVYLRWVGIFAAAVGGLYLRGALGPAARLREVLGATLIFRSAVGAYATFAVLRGWLAPVWSGVAIANLGLVAAQLVFLAKGAGRDG